MMSFDRYGDFSVFVDGEFLTVFSCVTYGQALDLMWPFHYTYPDSNIEIRFNGDSVKD